MGELKPKLDYGGWLDIGTEIERLHSIADEKEQKKVLREVGTCIKKYVKQYAPDKTNKPSNGKEYKHIKDDVTFQVKKSKDNDNLYVSVKGGKTTGYKWVFLNNGFTDRGGHFHNGTQFVDKAETASEQEVSKIIDDYIKEVLK